MPPEVAVIYYLGGSMRGGIPEAMKFAHGDDTGVEIPSREQTREEYDAERSERRTRFARELAS